MRAIPSADSVSSCWLRREASNRSRHGRVASNRTCPNVVTTIAKTSFLLRSIILVGNPCFEIPGSMNRRTHLGPSASGRLHRRLALFFLLFICSDIAFPPPCGKASEMFIRECQVDGSSVGAVSSLAPASECHSKSSPEETCRDEDCCFGCAHLLLAVALSDLGFFDAQTASPFLLIAKCYHSAPRSISPSRFV